MKLNQVLPVMNRGHYIIIEQPSLIDTEVKRMQSSLISCIINDGK